MSLASIDVLINGTAISGDNTTDISSKSYSSLRQDETTPIPIAQISNIFFMHRILNQEQRNTFI